MRRLRCLQHLTEDVVQELAAYRYRLANSHDPLQDMTARVECVLILCTRPIAGFDLTRRKPAMRNCWGDDCDITGMLLVIQSIKVVFPFHVDSITVVSM